MAAYLRLFVCVFVWDLMSHSRNFHSYADVTIPLNFDLCSALMAIEQWGFFSVPHLLWQGTFVYIGHLRGPRDIHAILVNRRLHYFFILLSLIRRKEGFHCNKELRNILAKIYDLGRITFDKESRSEGERGRGWREN